MHFTTATVTLVNIDFISWGKMSVADVFLDSELKCFQNFSITHNFCIVSDYVKAQAYICESLGGL